MSKTVNFEINNGPKFFDNSVNTQLSSIVKGYFTYTITDEEEFKDKIGNEDHIKPMVESSYSVIASKIYNDKLQSYSELNNYNEEIAEEMQKYLSSNFSLEGFEINEISITETTLDESSNQVVGSLNNSTTTQDILPEETKSPNTGLIASASIVSILIIASIIYFVVKRKK